MEELSTLVARLEKEHAELQAKVTAQEEARARELETHHALLDETEKHTAALEREFDTLSAEWEQLSARRDDVEARARSFGGFVWKTGYTTAVIGSFSAALLAAVVFGRFGKGTVIWIELLILLLGLFFIPRRQ